MPVSNQFPLTDLGAFRLALVGEAPGSSEVLAGRPFCGAAGQLLDWQLAKVGLLRTGLFVGNVSQQQPLRNEFDAFDWDGPAVQSGIAALLADLEAFRPNLIVTLGNVPLHLFMAGNVCPPRRRKGKGFVHDWPFKVTQWRGSLFESSALTTSKLWISSDVEIAKAFDPTVNGACPDQSLAVQPWKCLATLHPAFCLRSWAENFNLQRDLKLAKVEAVTATLNLPELDFDYGPQP